MAGAKFNLIQTNFTAGELSPRMLGRVDVVRYNNGAKALENVVSLIHGGAMRRPGTLYVASTKTHAKRSRLIPYVFSRTQAYQLEFGDGYMRVFTADGAQVESSPGVPYEITTPYTEAQLSEIDFCQRADTMFLWHEDVYPQRLQRFGNADWRIQSVPFTTEPFDELGTRPAATLTLSAATVGAGRTFTTNVAAFLLSDVGRTIEAGGGIGIITAYNTTQSVTVQITSAFDATSYTSSNWLLTGSPQTSVGCPVKEPVGTSTTLTLGAAGWRSEDVGRFVVMNGGLLKITGYTDSTHVTAEIRVALAATVAAEANSWALCRSMWGQEFGYPRTGSIHQQRLHCAFSPGFPQDGWMSRLGEYYDFEIGTAADAGYNYRIDSDQASPGLHLASVRSLVALTVPGEFTLSGGGDPITPTTIDIQNQSAFGAGVPAPVRIGNELLFASPAIDEETGNTRDEIRALSADRFDSNNYAAPDISALAEHVTEGGIVDMDAQGNLLWMVRADGVMATLRLDRDNDVVAACRQTTQGEFESVSVIPRESGARDVWVIVKRTIGGATKRYVERFVPGVYMDCAVQGDGVASATWSGFSHLEGETLAVRADGVVQPDAVVSGGQITLQRNATSVQAGLPFVPSVELMNPEVQGPAGSTQGLMIRSPKVVVRVKDTVGCSVNGRAVSFRNFTATLDEPPPPFSGDKDIEQLGEGVRGRDDLVITQPQAAPFHLLAVIRQIEVTG
jgi:hypothetical protein